MYIINKQISFSKTNTLVLPVSPANSLLIAFASLVHILLNVLLLEFPHSLNLIKVHNEASVIRMMQTDTLAAEYSQMIGAIEMFDSFWMLTAQLLLKSVLVFLFASTSCLFEVEISL